MSNSLKKHLWWTYIHEDLQELLVTSLLLLKKVAKWKEEFHDYAFVVFPAAKAYEGFLKTLFHDLGFITDDDFYGKRFRIGRALNPSLEASFRRESVYDKLVDFCQGESLADTLWETWKAGRNLLFHWFPNEKNAVSLSEANARITKILDAMDKAFEECKIRKDA